MTDMQVGNRQLAGVTVAFRLPWEAYVQAVELADRRGERKLSPTMREVFLRGLAALQAEGETTPQANMPAPTG